MGRMLGIEGFFASVAEKGHTAKQMFGMVQCVFLAFFRVRVLIMRLVARR